MSEKPQAGAPFHADFLYDEAALSDFEAMYLQKKETPLATRVLLGAVGAAGAIYFGLRLYREGLQLTSVGYLLICSVLLVVAFAGGRNRPDDTPAKYRRHYLGKRATFTIDENGVEMHLEGQKHYARSKFREIYGLYDTDRCLYCVIKGKAYYILPRDGIAGADAADVMKYLEKKCAKKFLHYDIPAK